MIPDKYSIGDNYIGGIHYGYKEIRGYFIP